MVYIQVCAMNHKWNLDIKLNAIERGLVFQVPIGYKERTDWAILIFFFKCVARSYTSTKFLNGWGFCLTSRHKLQ